MSQSSRLLTTDSVRVLFLTEIQNFMQSTKYVWRGISGSRAQEFFYLMYLVSLSLTCSLSRNHVTNRALCVLKEHQQLKHQQQQHRQEQQKCIMSELCLCRMRFWFYIDLVHISLAIAIKICKRKMRKKIEQRKKIR